LTPTYWQSPSQLDCSDDKADGDTRMARVVQVAAASAWALALAALIHRLPFGASNRDEAFYSAMPYSFLLGNRPYVDELALHQNAAILLLPFYRAYLTVVGSADGIIMFNRYLYTAYVGICSVAGYRFVRRLTGMTTGCCVGALIVTFSYYNIFALSYNTCGAFGFFCGVMCTANALLSPRPGWLLFGASLLFLSATFSYPGLAPAVLIYLVVVSLWLHRSVPRATFLNGTVGIGAGVAVAFTTILALMLWLGRAGVERIEAFSLSMGYGQNTLVKLNYLHSDAWPWHWPVAGFVALFAAIPVTCRISKRAPWIIAGLTPLAFAVGYYETLHLAAPTHATIWLVALPILAPVCLWLNRGWQYRRFVWSVRAQTAFSRHLAAF
jgi:hypothetical protein